MSDKPISVGDLVMVVRGHECVVARVGGIPYTVRLVIRQIHGGWFCPLCKTEDIGANEMFAASLSGLHTNDISGIPLGWLKRIPPPQEMLDEEHREEIAA